MRQEEELWDLLHAGVLTSSTLIGVTALCERYAAQRIPGWPQYMQNHSSALFAASRLARPLHPSFHESSAAEVQMAHTMNNRSMHSLNVVKLTQREALQSALSSGERPLPESCALTHTFQSKQPYNGNKNSVGKSVALDISEVQPCRETALENASSGDAALPAVLDTSWLGENVRVQMLGSVGPTNRRTRVWSLRAAAHTGDSQATCSQAKEPRRTSAHDCSTSEWLQGSTITGALPQGPKRKKKRKKGGKLGSGGSERTSQQNSATHETMSMQLHATTPSSICTGVQRNDCASPHGIETPCALEAMQHDEFVRQVHINAQLAMQEHYYTAQRVAGQGEGRLRTAWGSVQEAAALLEVLHMFTTSTVHEAGLCMLDQEFVPAEWGIDLQQLQVGASPDALIYHPSRGM